MYSRYDGSGSSVYAVKLGVERIMTNPVDAYSYNSGIEGNDTETHPGFTEEPTPEALAEMKLTPYKGLSSETIIRYLYTGREYNIETGDYYYRYRMMEAWIGRFTGKDIIIYLNLYKYVKNNPMAFKDKYGASEGASTNNDEYCEGLLSKIENYNKQIDVLLKNKPVGYQTDISKIQEEQSKLKSEYENNCDIEAVEIWTPEEQAAYVEYRVDWFNSVLTFELGILSIFCPPFTIFAIDAGVGQIIMIGWTPNPINYGYIIRRKHK